jgi:hypothetical protein
VFISLDLPADLLHRLHDEAVRRGVSVEDLITKTLERRFLPAIKQPISTLSFIGIGEAREHLSETHKRIRRDLAAGRDD